MYALAMDDTVHVTCVTWSVWDKESTHGFHLFKDGVPRECRAVTMLFEHAVCSSNMNA